MLSSAGAASEEVELVGRPVRREPGSGAERASETGFVLGPPDFSGVGTGIGKTLDRAHHPLARPAGHDEPIEFASLGGVF